VQVGSIQGAQNPFQNQRLQPAGTSNARARAVYTDPRDTNQDGIVSPAEALAYALKHPELAPAKHTQAATPQPYTAKGTLDQAPRSNALLDLNG
jgi:hypothetical protein